MKKRLLRMDGQMILYIIPVRTHAGREAVTRVTASQPAPG